MSEGDPTGPVDQNDLRPRVEALEARTAAMESRQLRAEHQLGELMVVLKEHEHSTKSAWSALDEKIQKILNAVVAERPKEEKAG